MSSNSELSRKLRRQLLDIARASIAYGLKHGRPLPVDLHQCPPDITAPRAVFVTLEKSGKLRGCIGSLEAHEPLVLNVSRNAYAAAFSDHRFPPVTDTELDALDIHLSILSPPEEIGFSSEQELIGKIRPGIDGLTLIDGSRKGTFLPSVWKSLSKPDVFLRHLKQKAGLPSGYWSPALRVYRYTAETIDESRIGDQE
ncbi:MAG: AmmeMemoRadiSam system protein A [Pseudomonadota bacterium]